MGAAIIEIALKHTQNGSVSPKGPDDPEASFKGDGHL
jgi:hypothetical protein